MADRERARSDRPSRSHSSGAEGSEDVSRELPSICGRSAIVVSWRALCRLSLIGILAGAALAPAGAAPPETIDQVAGAGPYFALTFDGHAEANGAAELLALLRERKVLATLFVTGRFALDNPALLRQAQADGHEIGNHTMSHPHLTTWAENHRHHTRPEITRERLQEELRSAAVAITAVTGVVPSRFWRAPYGEHNAILRAWASQLGLTHVDWTHSPDDSLDALDWVEDSRARNFLGPEAMARRLISFERRTGVPLAGAILLAHLGNSRPDAPLREALPIFLDEMDRRGLRPLTVGSLLHRAGR
ncbi:MAG: polysaccharide deacetylase family protein [Acidobacteriota bacterium]